MRSQENPMFELKKSRETFAFNTQSRKEAEKLWGVTIFKQCLSDCKVNEENNNVSIHNANHREDPWIIGNMNVFLFS